MWQRVIWLFLLFLLGRHLCFPASPRYIELADSADFYIANENWNKAEEKIIEALRLEPANFTNSLLLANLGLVQAGKGEFKKSIESLTLGLNIAPSSTVLLNNRAHTYLLIDSVASAKKDLDKSLEIDSIQEWPLQTRGFIYLQENNIPKALELFESLKENFPANKSVFTGLATIAELQENFNEAAGYYKKVLELNPGDDDSRAAYILMLINTDKYSEARSEIREALSVNPENPIFYLLRGYLHNLNFRMDEAQADKKIALSKGIDKTMADRFIP